jgi:serine/threonine protein kinase
VFQNNDILYNRYRLLESFGRGGFSVVWKALDEKTDTTVALKMFIKQDSEGIELCKQEFRKAHDLAHPYVVRPLFFDEYQGAPFLVMPFYKNGTALHQAGQLSEQNIAQIMQQIGSALNYLHTRTNSILHNDIKPDNFLISDEGDYLLSDFGISDQLQHKLTQTIGGYFAAEANSQKPGVTPIAYRAPELFPLKNFPKQDPSTASDVWALGASIYQLASGEPPFNGQGGLTQRIGMTSGSSLENLLEELPGQFSPVLKAWIYACLALEPTARPSARQLQKAAETFLHAGEWPTPPTTTAYSIPVNNPAPQKPSSPYPAWQPAVPSRQVPPPGKRMAVPVWTWVLATALACAGAFAVYKTNLDKTCSTLLAEADSLFSKADYSAAKAKYLEARACDPRVTNDLPERIKQADVLAKIQGYPASLEASEGLVAVGDTVVNRFRWGYLDAATGALKIPLQFDSVSAFKNGEAIAWKNGAALTIGPDGHDIRLAKHGKDNGELPPAGRAATASATPVAQGANTSYRPVGKVDFSLSESTAYTGSSIQFVDQSSPQGHVARRAWNFGDQQSADTKKAAVSHVYKMPGKYVVELCVNEGQQCATKTITIIADRPDLERQGSAGFNESIRNKCLADQGEPAWQSGSSRISLKPKTTLELQSAVLFGDTGGKVNISLTGANGASAATTRYINRGRSLVGLDDLGVTLEPGHTYTLTISPIADKKGTAPRLENLAACAGNQHDSKQLEVAYSGNGVLFNLAYLY